MTNFMSLPRKELVHRMPDHGEPDRVNGPDDFGGPEVEEVDVAVVGEGTHILRQDQNLVDLGRGGGSILQRCAVQ